MARAAGVIAIAAAVLSAGCSSEGPRDQPGNSDGGTPIEAVASGSPVVAREAFWTADGNAILIGYRAGREEGYAIADRFHEQNISPHGNWESVVYAAPADERAFREQASGAHALIVLPQQRYDEFILRLGEKLLPADTGSGVLLNRADKEFFFYRDDTGTVRMVTGMINKPASVSLANSYRVETLGPLVASEASAYLDKLGVDADTVLVSTGESGPYARPFAIFDRRTGRRVFVSLRPFRFGTMNNNLVEQTGKTAWNAGRSYWWDFWNRPVSHITRGILYALDTVRDTSRELSIKLFEFPDLQNKPIPPLAEEPGMDLQAWEAYLDGMFGRKSTSPVWSAATWVCSSGMMRKIRRSMQGRPRK